MTLSVTSPSIPWRRASFGYTGPTCAKSSPPDRFGVAGTVERDSALVTSVGVAAGNGSGNVALVWIVGGGVTTTPASARSTVRSTTGSAFFAGVLVARSEADAAAGPAALLALLSDFNASAVVLPEVVAAG